MNKQKNNRLAGFAIVAIAVAGILLAGCQDVVRSLGIEKPDYAKVTAARVTEEALITGISLKLTDCKAEDLYVKVPSDAPFTASIATDSNGAKIVFNLTSMPSSDYTGTIDVYKNGVSKKKASVNVTAAMITPVVTMTLPSEKINNTVDIPLTLKNITFAELALGPISATAKISAELKNDSGAKIVVTNKATTEEVTQNIADKIEVKTKTGTKLAECTIGPDLLYDYRKYNAGGTDYKFQLVKMFHFVKGSSDMAASGDKLSTSGGTNPKISLFTSTNTGNDTLFSSDGHYLTCDVQTNPGLGLTCWYGDPFTNGGFDYMEIKFRSGKDVKTKIGLTTGNGGANYAAFYSDGNFKVTDGTIVADANNQPFYFDPDATTLATSSATFDDSSADWHTIGFWNSTSGNDCLFVSDFIAKKETLSKNNNMKFSTGNYSVITLMGQHQPTDIDYIAFFKKQ